MLKFFRTIRRKLLEDRNLKKYLIYAVGEIFLIVVGILIAVQIGNINKDRLLKEDEKTVLLSFKKDLERSIGLIEKIMIEKRKIIEIDALLLSYTGPNPIWDKKHNFDSLMYYIIVSGWMHFPEDGTLTVILNSGKLSSIRNDSLRNLITSLPKQLETTRSRIYDLA